MKHIYMTLVAVPTLVIALSGDTTAQTTTSPSPVQPSPDAPQPLPPEPEAFNFTPFLGFGMAGDFENTPASFGAALGYGLNSRWGIEGDLSFAPGGEQGDLLEFDTSIWTLSGNVLYHFRAENFTPYVTFGMGLIGANADVEGIAPGLVDDDTVTEFAWNWGGGIKTAMNRNWGLRGDLRYFNGDDLAPDFWRLSGGVVFRRIGR